MSDKNNESLVSIVMNCFNGEAFLKESIESVLNQTYKNWELIFWDNQSKDRSAEILKKFKDERLKYFCADEHTSLYKARNLAIDKSKGDFISFIDTDDLWNKSKLELQMPFFGPQEVGVVYSNLWILKENVKKKRLYSKTKLPQGKIFEELIKNYNVGIVSAVLRKNFFLKLNEKFDERFTMIGDYDLFLRLSKICIFKSIQEPLASARIHGKNLTTLMKEEETREMELWIKENKCNLSDYNLQIVKKKLNYRKFVNSKIDGNYKQCIKMFLKSKVSFLNIKNLIILLMPIFILKKILWYHQN